MAKLQNTDFEHTAEQVNVEKKDKKEKPVAQTTSFLTETDFAATDKDFFTLPSEMPDVVRSEEYTGTLPVDDKGYKGYKSSQVTGLHDPGKQAVVGLVKGGNVTINALEDIQGTSPDYGLLDWRSYIPGYSVMADPGRLIDKVKPVANALIGGAEWLGKKGDEMSASLGGDETESTFELPRITGEFGTYPERATKRYKQQLKARYEREQFVRNYEKDFEEKKGSMPYITEVLSYAPDFLTAMFGGLRHIPKTAGFIEGKISGARASQDEEDVGQAEAFGAFAGWGGAKLSQWMLNSLSPKELENVALRMKDPLVKESSIAMLKYFADNPSVQRELVKGGKTGNALLDKHIDVMKEKMGEDGYRMYMEVLSKISDGGKATLKEATEVVSKEATEKYNAITKVEKDSWDEFLKVSDNAGTTGTEELVTELDKTLENAPPVIQNFAKRLMKNNSNELAINAIRDKKAVLFADYQQKVAGATKKEVKELKKAYNQQLKELNSDEVQLVGEQSGKALNLSIEDLSEKIKLINDKKFLKGSSINGGDKTQAHYLSEIRKQLEMKMESIEGFDKANPLYKKAKATSLEKFNTFGYGNTGKNMGKNVASPEVGKVIGETTTAQMKVIEDAIDETPAMFMQKMDAMDEALSPLATKKLRQYYVEKQLNNSLVKTDDIDALPTMNAERTVEALRKFTSTKEGRDLIKTSFPDGEDILQNMLKIEGLTKHIKGLEAQGLIEPSKLKAYLTQLPKTIKHLLSGRISDSMKTKRMLKEYGEETKLDWADVLVDNAANRLGGTAVGGIVAPEGEELKGMVAGSIAGKTLTKAKLLNKIPFVKKQTTKLKSKVKDYIKKKRAK